MIDIHEVTTQLPKLLAQVEQGDEVVIARAGKPVARLVSIEQTCVGKRYFGQDEGLYEIPADFDEPLSGEVIATFGL